MARIQPKREPVANVPGFYVTKRPSGNVYEFRLDGKWVRVPGTPSLNEAKQWRNRYLGLDTHERIVSSSTTFEELTAIAVEDFHQSPTTIDNYMRSYRTWLAPLKNRRVQDIDTELLLDLVVKPMKDAGLAGASVHSVLTAATVVFKKGIRKKLIVIDPVKGLESGKDMPSRKNVAREYQVLEANELKLLFDHAGALMPVYAVMALAGLRISEALALVWDDVRFETGQLDIRKQLRPGSHDRHDLKTAHSRAVIDMSPMLSQILAKHSLTTSTHPDDYVFLTRNNAPYSASHVEKKLKAICLKAGIPKVVPHELRHTCGSALLVATRDPAATCRQLRHANPQVTLTIYAHAWGKLAEVGATGRAIDASLGALLS